MGNGHGCYVGHSYVTTFRSKRPGAISPIRQSIIARCSTSVQFPISTTAARFVQHPIAIYAGRALAMSFGTRAGRFW